MKKTKITTLLLCCSLLFSACDSKEQKVENDKNLRQAESNAISYIENKYGFTPEIIESELERQAGLFGSSPDTTAMIKMSYNGKEFSVYIDGKDKNTEGADNYQQSEIISALTEKLTHVCENEDWYAGDIKSINVDGGMVQDFYPDVEWNTKNLYSEYFDGDNFAEIFKDRMCNITVDYINSDFGNLNKTNYDFLLTNERTNLYLISYRSEKDYQERPDYNVYTDFTGIKKHAIQIEESLVFEKDKVEHNEYILGKHDNFYYYVSDNAPDTVSFSPSVMPDASEYDGNGIIDGEFITPAYRINNNTNERIYIYYPLSELSEKSRLATCKEKDEEIDIHISPLAEDIGDYRMVYTQAKNSEISFAFITEKENINNEQ